MSGAVILPCDYCGQDMDVRTSWPVFGVRGCSPECARRLGLLHYGQVKDALIEELTNLEIRIRSAERSA